MLLSGETRRRQYGRADGVVQRELGIISRLERPEDADSRLGGRGFAASGGRRAIGGWRDLCLVQTGVIDAVEWVVH